ncbi:hypothetical protein KM176_24255 [Pseudooceanicola sp. CBS1P-1]|uniref:Uncharacterized protein n=1 Tax=Pseudooceanicola albus TaxID=2692189 RepID=A0A6L7GB02_9RHOB|nr:MULTISPECIES: hypothetical protein [Pseudooceanicola]MBT9386975.1 hypothetical protein [Pseudooceanicola endophyticus]MXN21159.1 hypothetical protein [Pseudooceanicola albus]
MSVDRATQLARLRTARALGVTQLSEDGRTISYRSLAEMDRIIADLEAELAGRSRRATLRQATPRTNRGL